MGKYLEREKIWKRSWMLKTSSRSALYQLHITKYHDDLCDDMKVKKPKTKWYEWFFPISATDYTSHHATFFFNNK